MRSSLLVIAMMAFDLIHPSAVGQSRREIEETFALPAGYR